MSGTLNPSSPSFTLQERTRSRRDGGTAITDTYVGPTAGLDAFLAPYTGASAPIPHPSHSGSVLDEIRERYDQSRTVVYVELTYVPASAGYAYTPLRPVGTVVIEAEPSTYDVPMSSLSSGDPGYDESKDSISRGAIQVSVIESQRNFSWTEDELANFWTGDEATPQKYFSGKLNDDRWGRAGLRIRESDGIAEKTRIWMFYPE